MRRSLLRLAGYALVGVLAVRSTAAADPTGTLAETLADSASLRAIAAIDATNAVAVGDRGVILFTDDGGRNWRRATSPTDARLDDVAFVDPLRGWAVGGSIRPHTHESTGVVLYTTNGGRDWRRVDRSAPPRLRAVRFFTPKRGVAAGDGAALHPSGVYTTDDGGQHWRPVPASTPQRWEAAAFARDPLGDAVGLLAGRRGASGRLTGRELQTSADASARRGGHAVRLVDATRGWMVGDGGLVRFTDDGGASWRPTETQAPETLGDWFDWRALATRGDRLLIAGSPGSLVLTTDDAGRTWDTATTGVTTPLLDLTLADDQHGWAVGALGVILATDDGGKSWRAQRGAGRRAAIGFATGTASDLPVELIAANAAAEGYRTALLTSLVPDGHAEAADTVAQVAEAGAVVGADYAASGWNVPLSPADAKLAAAALRDRLDRLTDRRTLEFLTREARNWLLAYQPDVVVVPDAAGPHAGAHQLVADAMRMAIDSASEPTVPGVGLEPWRVKRLLAATPLDTPTAAKDATRRLVTGDFSPLLGGTPAQWGRRARGLLSEANQPPPAAYAWRDLLDGSHAIGRRGDLMAGVSLPRGGDARRPAAIAPVAELRRLRLAAQKQKHLQQLLVRSGGDPAWAGQVVELTGGLDPEAGAELLEQLAAGYLASGQAALAADTRYLLARRYADSPLADAALLWLVRYYASGERAHTESHVRAVDSRPSRDALANLADPAGRPAAVPPITPGDAALSAEDRLERAARLIDFLEEARPTLHARPAVRFAEAAAQRWRGFVAEADRVSLVLSKQSIADDWRRAALAERWLAEPKGLPPDKPIAACRRTPRRPRLDGVFDEAVWARAEALPLTPSDGGEPTATVRMARDDEFLFIAIEALAASLEPVDPTVARPRDADLTDHDRVRLRIDLDRDYTTAIELTVDHRGWTHDAVDGDPTWAPQWWVAAATDEGAWRAEVAVPLAELSPADRLERAAWAVSAERLRPGEARAAWAGADAAADSPDAYGLLLLD